MVYRMFAITFSVLVVSNAFPATRLDPKGGVLGEGSKVDVPSILSEAISGPPAAKKGITLVADDKQVGRMAPTAVPVPHLFEELAPAQELSAPAALAAVNIDSTENKLARLANLVELAASKLGDDQLALEARLVVSGKATKSQKEDVASKAGCDGRGRSGQWRGADSGRHCNS
jgi:hypothetical protein